MTADSRDVANVMQRLRPLAAENVSDYREIYFVMLHLLREVDAAKDRASVAEFAAARAVAAKKLANKRADDLAKMIKDHICPGCGDS